MRYTISCRDCHEPIGETDDPLEAYDIAEADTDHNPGVTARGLINSVRFSRANRDRQS